MGWARLGGVVSPGGGKFTDISGQMCKPNIMYSVAPFTTIQETFHPIVERLRRDKSAFPRTIIYYRWFDDCADLYLIFRDQLGADFTEPPNSPDFTRFRHVDMFQSCTDPVVKEEIIQSFTCTKESRLRIVIATVAFGMGIDCHDVREVIHLGAPNDRTFRRLVVLAGMDCHHSRFL